MTRVILFMMELPHGFRAYPEPFSDRRLVVKNTIFYTIRFARVVEHETLVVFCTGIHHLTEHVECWKNTKESLVQTFTVLNDIFTKDKYIIDVGAQVR